MAQTMIVDIPQGNVEIVLRFPNKQEVKVVAEPVFEGCEEGNLELHLPNIVPVSVVDARHGCTDNALIETNRVQTLYPHCE